MDRSRARRARGVVALAFLALVVAPAPTRAAPPCRVSVPGGLVFGTYDVFSSAALVTSVVVTLQCPASPAPQVQISKGSSSTYTPRTLVSGSSALPYNVYLDSGFTRIWGDGTETSFVWAPVKSNAQITAWARVLPGQDVAAGSYSDDLVLTVLP